VPAVPHTRRRSEHTAASVFSNFPGKQAEAPAEAAEDSADSPGRKKRGRKPFSKQLARSMRQ
jgi:hypothetical protein